MIPDSGVDFATRFEVVPEAMEVELLVLGRRHVVVYLYLRLEPIFFTNVASFRQVCFRIAV